MDDDEAFCDLIVLALLAHCDVAHARTFGCTQDAVAELARPGGHPRPDLLLLDYRMPGMDAQDVLAAIRAIPVAPPTVVLSGAMSADECAGCFDAGAFAVIHKPANYDELVRLAVDLVGQVPTGR
ncbi:MAG: response regulator [Ramlibacter sp.]